VLTRLLSRLGLLRPTNLRFISGPTRVSIRGRLASPNETVSPMTGLRAALIELTAGARAMEYDATQDREIEVFRPLGTLVLGSPSVLVETAGGLVEIPTAGLRLAFANVQNLAVTSIDRPLPTDLQAVMDRIDRGVASYRELSISQGDAVRLEAVVGPRRTGPGGAGASDAAWEARPDLGPVVLHDESVAGASEHFARDRRWLIIGVGIAVVAACMGYAHWKSQPRPARTPPPTLQP
jgi:hypothetical protein